MMNLSNIEFAAALRKLADFYEQHPKVAQPGINVSALLDELAAIEYAPFVADVPVLSVVTR